MNRYVVILSLLAGVLVAGARGADRPGYQRVQPKGGDPFLATLEPVLAGFDGKPLPARPAADSDALLPDGYHPNAAAHAALADPMLGVILVQAKPLTLNFTKRRGGVAGGAVLDVGGPGTFDDKWATCPSVLREGDGYRMWYSSYFNGNNGLGGIALATSKDGLSWTREHGGRPVLPLGPEGAFDDA